jgi:aspartyl/asparaginyl beta-hydroxylase (cupin superfamily)
LFGRPHFQSDIPRSLFLFGNAWKAIDRVKRSSVSTQIAGFCNAQCNLLEQRHSIGIQYAAHHQAIRDGNLMRNMPTIIKRLSYATMMIPNAIITLSTKWRLRPAFYDIDKICPQLRLLESNFARIKAEYDQLCQIYGTMPSYDYADPLQKRIAAPKHAGEKWSVFFLEAMGLKPQLNRNRCPELTGLLEQIPNVFQCCYSILDGGKSIPPHHSPYRGYLRYHLGIEIPHSMPPRMRVGSEWTQWQEGAGFLFDDTIEHEIINPGTSRRAVLIVDIARPMGWAGRLAHSSTSQLLKVTYARSLIRNASVFD